MGDTFNSNDNINIAHGISLWFQKDFTGAYVELGDCTVSANNESEYYDFNSYRNGRFGLRKRLLVKNSGSITVTLNEIHAVNYQRVVYGGTVTAGASCTMRDARQLTVARDTSDLYVDLITDASEVVGDMNGGITVTGIYPDTDVLHTMGATIVDTTPNSDGKVYFTHTDIEEGDTVYVTYTIAKTGMYSTEIFGATDSVIEGAAQLNVRNMSGGRVQCWDIASVTLAPNGEIPFPLDAPQTLPLTMTMQERGGTWGTIYIS